MATIITISSQVIRGHVGNSATTFILQRLGHNVLAFHTTYLSNHPGHKNHTGNWTVPAQLHKNFSMLKTNGWLQQVDAIMTGYLPSKDHVGFAIKCIKEIKTTCPKCTIICDPTLGDHPKGLYIDLKAAYNIKDSLLPLANIITPNKFELEWLTEIKIKNLRHLMQASQTTNVHTVLTTSAPSDNPENIDNHLYEYGLSWVETLPKRHNMPKGTGDTLSALFLGYLLKDNDKSHALTLATKALNHILAASEGKDELEIIGTQDLWSNVS